MVYPSFDHKYPECELISQSTVSKSKIEKYLGKHEENSQKRVSENKINVLLEVEDDRHHVLSSRQVIFDNSIDHSTVLTALKKQSCFNPGTSWR